MNGFWPHQIYGVQEVRRLMAAGRRRICLCSPTGGGKSKMMMQIAEDALSEGKRVLQLASRKWLLDQLYKGLTYDGFDVRQMRSGIADVGPRDYTLASIPTLAARNLMPEADVILVDEAHMNKADRAAELLNRYHDNGGTIIGVTATPLEISHLYDDLILAGSRSELRKCGALVPALVYSCGEMDTQDIKRTPTGEFSLGEIRKKIWTQAIYARVIEEHIRVNPELRPAILFAPGVEESVWFVDEYAKRGIRAAHIDGDDVYCDGIRTSSSQDRRDEVLQQVRTGEIKVVCNRFVMREGLDCLDDQTEILTENGWIGINDHIKLGTKVWSLNKTTNKAELVHIDGVGCRMRREDERMVSITSQHMNIRVTEGHRFHLKSFHESRQTKSGSVGVFAKSWMTQQGRDLLEHKADYAIPISADGEFDGLDIPDDWIRVLAWAVTDGGLSTSSMNRSMLIYQKKPKYIVKIRALLSRLGVPIKEHKQKRNGLITWSIKAKDWKPFLAELYSKQGHKNWHKMTNRQFQIFWNALCHGDGHWLKKAENKGFKNPQLVTANKDLADHLQIMAILRGYACNIGEAVSTASGNPYWYLIKRKTKFIQSRASDSRSADIVGETVFQPERVWCVSNCNDTLFTRRNGKVAIIGNCPELHHLILATPVGSILSHAQIVGRVLRNHPSMPTRDFGDGRQRPYCIITDHGGNWWRHPSPNADLEDIWRQYYRCGSAKEVTDERMDALRNNQESQGDPLTKEVGYECPACHAVQDFPRTGNCYSCGHDMKGKRRRTVIQRDGSLQEVTTLPVKRAKKANLPDVAKAFERAYWMAKKKNASFRQAAAWIQTGHLRGHEHLKGCQIPKDLPFMPANRADMSRLVNSVPMNQLIRKNEGVQQ
jgi:superfamily II DNA or RNA helicase